MSPTKKITLWAAAIFIAAFSGPLQAQELTIGTIGASSDAPFFIADAKGYFAEQGLKVSFVRFDSAAKSIPSLGSGEVDVGSGASSAGLYNAVARGIGIKIVADKARNAKGYGFQAIMARTDLIDSRKVKGVKDLKGLKVAMSANGNSENAFMNYALVQQGLSYSDIDPVFLGFPNQIAAYANKAIDASLTVEPTVAELLKLGTAKKLISADDVFPDYQTAVVFYGPKFMHDQPENAKKFLVGIRTGNVAVLERIVVKTSRLDVSDHELLGVLRLVMHELRAVEHDRGLVVWKDLVGADKLLRGAVLYEFGDCRFY